MADTTTTSFELGDPVPAFSLDDTDGQSTRSPQDPAPPATVLVVTCMHCPYVIAWNPRLRAVAEEYAPRGVRFLAINANDASRYPADSLDAMKRFVARAALADPLPARRGPGRRPRARRQVTPHVFVLDGEHRLVYRGAPDSDTRTARNAAWLRAALDAALAGRGAGRGRDPPARMLGQVARLNLLDAGAAASFGFEDMLRYHGPGSPGGVAHAYKVLERALPLLAPDGPPERREIVVRTAFGGPGARDGFELVTRAVTEGRYTLDPSLALLERGRRSSASCSSSPTGSGR